MKNNRRQGKKIAVPKTENLRYVGPVTRKQARDAGDDDSERVTLDKLRKVNAAGTNRSAAAGSTLLNIKRLHEDTEDLAFNAAGTTKSAAAAGSTSLNTKRLHKDTEDLACDSHPKVDVNGRNKSAAARSRLWNIKKLYNDTEDLAFNAAGTSEPAEDCRVVVKYTRAELERRSPNSNYPPRPPPPKSVMVGDATGLVPYEKKMSSEDTVDLTDLMEMDQPLDLQRGEVLDFLDGDEEK